MDLKQPPPPPPPRNPPRPNPPRPRPRPRKDIGREKMKKEELDSITEFKIWKRGGIVCKSIKNGSNLKDLIATGENWGRERGFRFLGFNRGVNGSDTVGYDIYSIRIRLRIHMCFD